MQVAQSFVLVAVLPTSKCRTCYIHFNSARTSYSYLKYELLEPCAKYKSYLDLNILIVLNRTTRTNDPVFATS